MPTRFLQIAAIAGTLAVILGAFGAHSLKPLLDDYQIAIYEKGIQYQFYHSIALLAVGLLQMKLVDSVWLRRAGWCFLFGMICFSGSLYLLACRNLIPFSVSWAGPVTPLGGLGFIAGWISVWLGVRK